MKSAFVLAAVDPDSWMINPSSGFLALSNSFGTTTLNLYSFSSILLASSFLLKNETFVLDPKDETPPIDNALYIPLPPPVVPSPSV